MKVTIKMNDGREITVHLPKDTVLTSDQLGIMTRAAKVGAVRNGVVVE